MFEIVNDLLSCHPPPPPHPWNTFSLHGPSLFALWSRVFEPSFCLEWPFPCLTGDVRICTSKLCVCHMKAHEGDHFSILHSPLPVTAFFTLPPNSIRQLYLETTDCTLTLIRGLFSNSPFELRNLFCLYSATLGNEEGTPHPVKLPEKHPYFFMMTSSQGFVYLFG